MRRRPPMSSSRRRRTGWSRWSSIHERPASGRLVTAFGYTMMTEQSRPDQLVTDLVAAEAAGFDFSVCSDHYQPWLAEQGHAGYAWSILGAAAYATEWIGVVSPV